MSKRRTAAEVLAKIASEGKGLRAARPSAKAQVEDATLTALRRNVGRVVLLPVNKLVIEKNVRKILDTGTEEFTSLVEDIRLNGVKQNIAVELEEGAGGGYRLVVVFGQRRVLAARQANLDMIPALIVPAGDEAGRIFMGLAENILRAEMHPLDKAEAYQELIDAGWSIQTLSEKFERKKRTVQGFLRLARFPTEAKAVIRAAPEHFTAHLLFNRFLGRAWPSEAALVEALRAVSNGKNRTAAPARLQVAPEVKRLADSVCRRAGVMCRASGAPEGGKLILSWRSREELEKLHRIFK